MSKPASDKQMQFRANLIDDYVAACASTHNNETKLASDKARAFAEAVLVVNLPAPATMDEASEQIGALKGGSSILSYARAHADWAQPILNAIAARNGNDAPVIEPDHFWTVSAARYTEVAQAVLA